MSRPKPILLVVLPATVVGGAETSTLALLDGLTAFRTVLVTQAALASYFASTPSTIRIFEDYGCKDPYLLTPDNIRKYGRVIRKIMFQERADIVLGTMHNGTVFVSVATLGFKRVTAVGSILGQFTAYFKSVGRAPSFLERALIWFCFRWLHGLITPSNGVKDDLVANFGAIPEKVRAIHNGIDLESIRIKALAPLAIQKTVPWIVTACRLEGQKDFRTLLAAFARIRVACDCKLVIIGDGPLRGEIERMATELGIASDVVFTGFMDNPFAYVAQADVFVLSSFFEGFGNVIVEAMALGIPVVSSDCPSGPAEIVEDAKNGFLVPVGDDEAMAARCLSLLRNPLLHEQMSKQALTRSEEFSVSKMVDGYQNYLLSLTCHVTHQAPMPKV